MRPRIGPLALALISALPGFAPAATDGPVRRETLDNGVTIVTQQRPGSGTFAVRVIAMGGTIEDPDDQIGLTPLLSRMLLRGTASRTASEQATEVEREGAGIDTVSGPLAFGIQAAGPGPAFARALDVAADAILAPAMRPEDVSRETTRERIALESALDDPAVLLGRAIAPAVFAGHPLGRIADEKRYLAGVGLPALRAAHRRRVVGRRLIVVIVGETDMAAARERATALFGRVPPGSPAPPPPPPPRPLERDARRRVRHRTSQAEIAVALPTPGIGAGDEETLDLLARILAGVEERLYRDIRGRRGWAYWVSAADWRYPGAGMFGIVTAVPVRRLDDTEEIIRAAIAALAADGPSEEEVDRARRSRLTTLARAWQRSEARAADYAAREARGLALLSYEDRASRIAGVTPAAIRDLALRIVEWSSPAIVTLH